MTSPGDQPDPRTHPVAQLLSRRQGVLSTGETIWTIKFIVDSRRGVLVAPLTHHAVDHQDATLYVPDEHESAPQAHVAITPMDVNTNGEAMDRWQAYHGRAEAPVFADLRVLGVRLGPAVLDQDECELINPLGTGEFALCKAINAQREKLVSALARAGVDEPNPTCVGVDAWGIDARTCIGVVRVAFGVCVSTVEQAQREIERIMEAGG
jgi:hypothetical protein